MAYGRRGEGYLPVFAAAYNGIVLITDVAHCLRKPQKGDLIDLIIDKAL